MTTWAVLQFVMRNFAYIEIAVSRDHDEVNTVNKQEKRNQCNLKSE